MRERIPVSILAGMALILHRHVPALADLLGPVDLLLERIGAGRSQAFAMCHRLLELLPALFRGPGRPRRAPVEEMSLLPVVEACFDYLARHPGAIAVGRQRRQYSDGYRRFVVNLAGPGGLAEGLTVADLSRASQVPLGTLKEWLSPPPDRGRKAEGRGGAESQDSSPSDAAAPEDQGPDAKCSVTVRDTHLRQLFALWQGWHGTFAAFCDAARHEHGLPYSMSFIGDALQAAGLRFRKPQSAGQAHWTRETYMACFPGAQWLGDGTSIAVCFGERIFVFNVEALLDVASNAAVGIHVSATEDEEALLAAYGAGLDATGSPPLAMTLDNRPSNHTPGVAGAIAPTMLLRSTPGRPEAKAPIEGSFGLFRQAIPPLVLEGATPRDIARSHLQAVMTAWFRGRNGRPRRRLNGRSPVEAYREAAPTQEEVDRAARELRERQRRQEAALQTQEAKRDPVRRRLLAQGLEDLGIADPEGSLAANLARYSPEAISYGLATFSTKRGEGTLPPDADPGRYLGGIIRKDHEKRYLRQFAEHLLEQRLRLRDFSLGPLVGRAERLRAAQTPLDLPRSYADLALEAQFDIDFRFWARAAAEALAELPPSARSGQYRHLCRLIAGTFKTPADRREILIDRLATAATQAA